MRWPACARSRMRWASSVPPTAELIRNIMLTTQYVQDHVIHFYHLHALDWVDIVNALKADPKKAAELAQSFSKWDKNNTGVLHCGAGQDQGLRGERTGHFCQRLLGPSGVQAAAGGEPDRRCALSGCAGVAEGNGEDSRRVWRQESAPELPCRRRAVLDQHERGCGDQLGAAEPGIAADQQGRRVRQRGLHSRPAGGGLVLQGLGEVRRRAAQLSLLRRVSDQGLQPSGRVQVCARRGAQSRPEHGASGESARLAGDQGVHCALLVHLRRRKRRGCASMGGRDEDQLHGPEAAVRNAWRDSTSTRS